MTALALLVQKDEHAREGIEGPSTPQWLDRIMEWALQGVPPVVQKLGGPVGLVLAVVVVALVVWKRKTILGWWRRRSAIFKRAVVAVVALGAIAAFGTGAYVWDYVQHDNNFCNSCHVMQEPFERFQMSEHSDLGCHDCHSQSVWASLRQLRLWVANRPEEVGPHAPVPTEVCADCHITEDPDSTWQRISATVGHRVHLEADTSALKNVMCVTCHGKEVHRFTPVDETCGQSGCHDPDKTQIVLGDMAGQTHFHCVTCHQFTAPVSEEAPLDTVRVALVPALEQCRSCHAMEKVLAGLDPDVDPHNAVCGTCHNPHTQESPAVAAGRCAECHAPAETLTPFHRGLRSEVVENCVGCHEPHTFLVEGDDCVACHADIVGGTPTAGPRAPEGQQTRLERDDRREAIVAAVARKSFVRPIGLVSAPDAPTAMGASLGFPGTLGGFGHGALQQPRFNHLDHRDIQCTSCHVSRRTHGEVTLESRTQCLQCHHSRVAAARGCARCHTGGEISDPRLVEVAMTIRGQTTPRRIAFDHDNHASVGCATCHTDGPTLGVSRTCASCHENHHTPTADCTTCHRATARQAHTREVHTRGCAGSGCHQSDQYGSMTQGRNTCLACHGDRVDHRPGRACAACHRVTFASGPTSTTARRR
jgi:predicted CXXCH cytochrome family protein